MVAYAYNSSIWEAEVGILPRIQGQPGLHNWKQQQQQDLTQWLIR